MKKIEIATFVLAIIGIICGIVGYCTEVQWAMDTAWMMVGACTTTFVIHAWPKNEEN